MEAFWGFAADSFRNRRYVESLNHLSQAHAGLASFSSSSSSSQRIEEGKDSVGAALEVNTQACQFQIALQRLDISAALRHVSSLKAICQDLQHSRSRKLRTLALYNLAWMQLACGMTKAAGGGNNNNNNNNGNNKQIEVETTTKQMLISELETVKRDDVEKKKKNEENSSKRPRIGEGEEDEEMDLFAFSPAAAAAIEKDDEVEEEEEEKARDNDQELNRKSLAELLSMFIRVNRLEEEATTATTTTTDNQPTVFFKTCVAELALVVLFAVADVSSCLFFCSRPFSRSSPLLSLISALSILEFTRVKPKILSEIEREDNNAGGGKRKAGMDGDASKVVARSVITRAIDCANAIISQQQSKTKSQLLGAGGLQILTYAHVLHRLEHFDHAVSVALHSSSLLSHIERPRALRVAAANLFAKGDLSGSLGHLRNALAMMQQQQQQQTSSSSSNHTEREKAAIVQGVAALYRRMRRSDVEAMVLRLAGTSTQGGGGGGSASGTTTTTTTAAATTFSMSSSSLSAVIAAIQRESNVDDDNNSNLSRLEVELSNRFPATLSVKGGENNGGSGFLQEHLLPIFSVLRLAELDLQAGKAVDSIGALKSAVRNLDSICSSISTSSTTTSASSLKKLRQKAKFLFARALLHAGHHQDAMTVASDLLTMKESDNTLCVVSAAQMCAGQTTEALVTANKIVSSCLSKVGDTAATTTGTVNDSNNNSLQLAAGRALSNRALLLVCKDKLVEAREAISKAYELAPNDLGVVFNFAEILSRSGESRLAADRWITFRKLWNFRNKINIDSSIAAAAPPARNLSIDDWRRIRDDIVAATMSEPRAPVRSHCTGHVSSLQAMLMDIKMLNFKISEKK